MFILNGLSVQNLNNGTQQNSRLGRMDILQATEARAIDEVEPEKELYLLWHAERMLVHGRSSTLCLSHLFLPDLDFCSLSFARCS